MPNLELKIRSRDIETLLTAIRENSPEPNLELIRKAYDFASRAHADQKRLSGEPYITHPLEVAIILARLRMDCYTISAALLHDVVEDTGISVADLEKEFGDEIARLVDGVTKISSIKNKSKASAQAETLRKMLFATVEDVRVIIIKLADKLHNMRTIMFQHVHRQYRIAKETMDLYAPIARRLGMNRISSELEDLSFFILYFEEYNEIRSLIDQKEHELDEYIDNVRNTLLQELKATGIKCEVYGRAKHLYSIFKKMQNQDKSFDEIYDIRAIRVITDEVKDCYGILGVIHTLWSPIASRFKDYIAVPKANMYQSLHTSVIGPQGLPLEVQIRTWDMHTTAEMGIAAHWIYKEKKSLKEAYRDMALLQNMTETYGDANNSREFLADLKMDLYEDEIFVFTPKGKIINLAKDATPVDFAYAIHTDVGNSTTGAKVNNRMVPLKTRLKSGDIVDILTSKKGKPSREWLKFVKSSNARYKIRNWLRKNSPQVPSPEIEEEKTRKKKQEQQASVTIPEEEQIKLKKISKGKQTGISIDGATNVMIKLSQCCQPIPGDDVIGFITRGRGISIHKKDCPQLERLMTEPERLINIVWEEKKDAFYSVKLLVRAEDRPNLLKDVADELSNCGCNIIKAEAEVKDHREAIFKFILEVKSNDHLNEIIKRIEALKNVTSAYKMNEKVVLK